MAFGGTPSNGRTETKSVEATNQLSWFSENNKHRIRLTTDCGATSYSLRQGNNARHLHVQLARRAAIRAAGVVYPAASRGRGNER